MLCFYRVVETLVEVWRPRKSCRNTCLSTCSHKFQTEVLHVTAPQPDVNIEKLYILSFEMIFQAPGKIKNNLAFQSRLKTKLRAYRTCSLHSTLKPQSDSTFTKNSQFDALLQRVKARNVSPSNFARLSLSTSSSKST